MSDRRRLTRRDALSGVAAVGAGLLIGPGVARAATFPRATRQLWRHELGTLRAGIAARVRVERPFCLAAVAWTRPAHAHLQLRTRAADGRWGPWAIASTAGHDGDGVRTGETQVGEGIWVGRATELQLRSDGGAVDGVALTFVAAPDVADAAVRGPAADLSPDALALAGPTLDAGPGQPAIIARSAWAGADHPPVAGPFYAGIEMGIVHHTENPNGYAPGDVPGMLQAIYEFHVHGRGWYDIGYNFVIDRFGRIWEARQGGIDLPVIGAQAGDWNTISTGISMLGTYSDVVPSAASMRALEHLLAWKLALSGLPATGEIEAVVAADGVSYTQFRVGQRVRFPRIAGHRDVDSTDCPGDALYAQLPALRRRVAALLGSPATLSIAGELSTTGTATNTLALSGRLLVRGRPLADAPIAVEAIVGRLGDTRTLATATTDAAGAWSTALPARAGQLLRALHPTQPATASDLLSVTTGLGAQDSDS